MPVTIGHDIARLNAHLEGRYRIERLLGEGGMATVYLAEDVRHRRLVAVKVLRQELASAVGAERFLREVKIAAQLAHPHIVPVHDSGAADGVLYYVMPFIEGETLRSRLAREGPLPIASAVRILREILDALSKAHGLGIVHRDIKPENVMLADEHAQVMDFGMAKVAGDASARSSLTSAGLAVGTPSYMSPEQAAGESGIDHRADIYAVGVLAYEMLAGRVPFVADTAHQVAMAHLTRAPLPVARLRSGVPARLAGAVMRCLAKDPGDRWQSAAELAAVLDGPEVSSPGLASPRITVRSVLSARWLRYGLAAAAVAVAVLAGGRWLRPGASPTSVTDPDLVAVLPFRVSGADPSLGYLREGMVDLLWIRLNGEGGLRAADPDLIAGRRDLLAGLDTAEPGADQLERVGRSVGAGRVLSGSVVGTPDHVVVSAAVTPVDGAAPPARASVDGPADSIVVMVDRLVAQLLIRGAGIPEVQVTSLARHPVGAVRAYLAGRAARRAGDYDAAVGHFREALDHDSTFAHAGLELIFISGWTVVPDLWEIQTRVWALRGRLSERDRLLVDVRGLFPTAARSVAQRLAMAEEAAGVLPSDPELWEIMADLYFHSGALLGIRDAWRRAEQGFRRALAADPDRAGPQQHLIHMLALAGDTAELAPMAQRYFRQDSTSELSLFLQWLVAVVRGDDEGRDRLRGTFDSTPYLGAQVAEVGEVDLVGLEDVDSALAASRRRASTQGERSFVHLKSAFHELNRGRPRDAERHLDAVGSQATRMMAALFWDGDSAAVAGVPAVAEALAREPQPDDEPERTYWARALCLVPVWALARGDLAEIDARVERVARSAPPGDTTNLAAANRVCLQLVEAMLASRRNDEDALRQLAEVDSLAATGPVWWNVVPLNLIIARLYHRHGETERALAAVRRRPYWSGTFSGVAYLTSHLLDEARYAVALGDTAAAVDAYEHYLRLRSDPEPALVPQRDAVRAELARLLRAEGG